MHRAQETQLTKSMRKEYVFTSLFDCHKVGVLTVAFVVCCLNPSPTAKGFQQTMSYALFQKRAKLQLRPLLKIVGSDL